MNIGKAIKLCRNQKGWTQNDLAKKANISLSYVSLMEQGKRNIMLSTLKKISDCLEIPVSLLVFLSASKKELTGVSDEIIEKLSKLSLELMNN